MDTASELLMSEPLENSDVVKGHDDATAGRVAGPMCTLPELAATPQVVADLRRIREQLRDGWPDADKAQARKQLDHLIRSMRVLGRKH